MSNQAVDLIEWQSLFFTELLESWKLFAILKEAFGHIVFQLISLAVAHIVPEVERSSFQLMGKHLGSNPAVNVATGVPVMQCGYVVIVDLPKLGMPCSVIPGEQEILGSRAAIEWRSD